MATLRQLFERLLGVAPSEPGQGTQWRLEHSFPWPPWVLLLFLLAAVVTVVVVYQRDAGGATRRMRLLLVGLRLAAIACLLFFLSEAVLSIERTGLPYVCVLLDVSGSMETPDQYPQPELQEAAQRFAQAGGGGGLSRLNVAKGLLTGRDGAFLGELQVRHKVRLYTFAEEATWLGGRDLLQPRDLDSLLPLIAQQQPHGGDSRPGGALRHVLQEFRGTLPAAVIVLTDGISTTGDNDRLSAAAEQARAKAVPLYAVGIGNEEPVRDLALYDTLVDEVAFVDDPVTFQSRVRATGCAGQTIQVQLRRSENNAPLKKQSLKVKTNNEVLPVELTYTPTDVGEIDFVLEVLPLEKEFRLDNNSELRRVSVRKEKIRVLLVDAEPRYEFRYLKHLLERDRTIELATVLQEADPGYAEEDATARAHFPVRKEELFQFDVVVFGDVNLDRLGAAVLDNLREFVSEQGGGLLMIAGARHNPADYGGTPLETLLPVEMEGLRVPAATAKITEGFRPELTVEGMKGTSIFRFADDEPESLKVWKSLPPFYWLVEVSRLKPGALPLVTHSTRVGSAGKLPLFVLQRYGGGKVLFHATDETWRWRFRAGDLYFGRYWVQAIRYLCRSRILGKDRSAELIVDRTVYRRGEPVSLRVRFLDDRAAPAPGKPVTVVVERQGAALRRVELTRLAQAPSVFEGQLSQLPEGSYHAWIAEPAFTTSPPAKDFRVESPNRETKVLRMDAGDLRLAAERSRGAYYTLSEAERLPAELPAGQPVPLKTDDPIRLWNHWLPLMLFCTFLAAEWMLRKRARLL